MPGFTAVVALLVSGLASMAATKSDDPPGHLMPIGSHLEPYPVERVDEFLHPQIFYDDYVTDDKPVIFKSSLEKIDFKPLKQWNDHYLRDKFGTIKVQVKTGKKQKKEKEEEEEEEDEEDHKIMPLAQYLDGYKHTDAYFKKQLNYFMRDDVRLLDFLRCGGFQNILTSATMTFRRGNTKTRLQVSSYDNIICLLDGTNDVVMYDKAHTYDILKHGFNHRGSYSTVDVERVDMYKYPDIGRLPWHKATMKRGDCLYIPGGWFHHVNSSGDRNLAIELSLYHHHWFNHSDCQTEDVLTNVNLNKHGFAGKREVLRELLLNTLMVVHVDDANLVTEEDFHELWLMTMVSVAKEESMKVFYHMDEDMDGVLSGKELYSADILDLYKQYPKAFGNKFRETMRDELDTLDNPQLHDDYDLDNVNAEVYQAKEEL